MPFKPFLRPRVSFIFHMPIPAYVSRKNRPIYESGAFKHEVKPDVDNLAKLYMDCLTGIVYDDDKSVQLGYVVKLYHHDPKTIILIQETKPFLTASEVDPLIYCALFGPESGNTDCQTMDALDDFYTPDHLAL